MHVRNVLVLVYFVPKRYLISLGLLDRVARCVFSVKRHVYKTTLRLLKKGSSLTD